MGSISLAPHPTASGFGLTRRAVTAAARQLLHNPNPSATVPDWPMQHLIATSLLWSIALLAIFAPFAVHLYRSRTTD